LDHQRLGYQRLGYQRLDYQRLGYQRLGYQRLGYQKKYQPRKSLAKGGEERWSWVLQIWNGEAWGSCCLNYPVFKIDWFCDR